MPVIKTDSNGTVVWVHNAPDLLPEELLVDSIHVDSIPEPEQIEGKSSTLKYSEIDGLYYEYADIPPTQEELQQKEIEGLKERLEMQDRTMEELMFIIIPELNGGGL